MIHGSPESRFQGWCLKAIPGAAPRSTPVQKRLAAGRALTQLGPPLARCPGRGRRGAGVRLDPQTAAAWIDSIVFHGSGLPSTLWRVTQKPGECKP